MVKTNGHRYGHRMGTVWAPYGHLQILATSGTGAFTHVAICTFRGFVEYKRPQCRRMACDETWTTSVATKLPSPSVV